MMPTHGFEQLKTYFSGLTEYAFETRLGVADTHMIEYISDLLVRFIRCDAIYRVRNLNGNRLDQVADMLIEADGRIGHSKREVHRHIGDFALFWTGLYPEALRRAQAPGRKDYFLDYCEQGKRNYYIASTLPADTSATNSKQEENELLERLSHDFELCVYGLGEIRREWERLDGPDGKRVI